MVETYHANFLRSITSDVIELRSCADHLHRHRRRRVGVDAPIDLRPACIGLRRSKDALAA
jgi:hypothetical protein